MGFLKKIRDKKNALKAGLVNSVGYYSYYNKKIDNNIVYIVCQSGENLIGNMLRIAQELSKPEYKNLKIYVQVKKQYLNKVKDRANRYQIKAHFLVRTSEQIYILEQAKYIFTDVVVPREFVKKDGQIMVNTWHGTPFKNMGRRIETEKHTIGNVQRNLIMSDYILFPNNYTEEIFIRDYMLDNLWKGKSLLAGYPRNAVFYDMQRKNEVIRELHLLGKKIYAYLPTFRGLLYKRRNIQQVNDVENYLAEIDTKLSDEQVLIVKLHLYNKEKIDFSKYKHIIDFPEGYETYDVLNIVDCLITDYSSVFFDFANTGKKIVLFTYDEEEYFRERGTYFNLNELPFPKVTNVDDLFRELNLPKNYDDRQFLNTYCPFDNINATKFLCEHIIKQKTGILLEKKALNNGKKNVMIYIGNLSKNGITTAALNLLNSLDHSEKNYIAVFSKEITRYAERVQIIPENINYYAIDGTAHYRLKEKKAYNKLLKQKRKLFKLSKTLSEFFDREWEKYFHGIDIYAVIDFCGYDEGISFIFSRSVAKKIIFVHNDMINEAKTRHIQNLCQLYYLYNNYDKVAIVSNNLYESTLEISEKKENIVTVSNCHDYLGIQRKSKEVLTFEKDTECIVNDPRGLLGILEDDKNIKFITIGRFSPEKGHLRLIDAFDMYWQGNNNSFLIIIGGHGILFAKTVNYAKSKSCWRNIIIIKSIMNPMPILKKCNLFILSSFYEGLGLVLLEADCLGVPSVSTDVVGPREFLNKYNGILVDDSTEGLVEGMRLYDKGEIRCLTIDYEKYNQQSVAEFKACLDN